MTKSLKGPKFTGWVLLLPIMPALFVSALVGLQLFQDGSSYLFELLMSHSAVRHGRFTIYLFQLPIMILVKAVDFLQIDSLAALPYVRFAFAANYALTPFIALLFSWLVVRKGEEGLFVWAALIILFVNLVNFSWVSELLMALQFACPLLLGLLRDPGSKMYWSLLLILTPIIFFLHPLVITIFLTLAMVSAYISRSRLEYRYQAKLSMIIFLSAAALRGIYSLFSSTPYEASFLAVDEARGYLFSASMENVLFLVVAVEIAFIMALARTIVYSRRLMTVIIPWILAIQILIIFGFAGRKILGENPASIILIGCLGVSALIFFRLPRNRAMSENLRAIYVSLGMIAVGTGAVLVAQYVFYERSFPLKTGLALFAALLVMLAAAIDSQRTPLPNERVWRWRLVLILAMIFASVIFAKSLMWRAAVSNLRGTLSNMEGLCVERTSPDFQWVESNPSSIINNWALPSLALVVQDHSPRRLLLEENDCRIFDQTGMAQVDPWSLIDKRYIVPPLD